MSELYSKASEEVKPYFMDRRVRSLPIYFGYGLALIVLLWISQLVLGWGF